MKTWRRFCIVPEGMLADAMQGRNLALSWGVVTGLSTGDLLVECELDDQQFAAIQQNPAVLVLPSLSAPAARVSGRAQAVFLREGIVAEAGDTLLDLLRRLRNSRGAAYDISNPT